MYYDYNMSEIEISATSKISTNKINLKKWVEQGNTIPICINEGCEKKVSIRHWSEGNAILPSLKTECSRCSNARKNNKHIDGVTFHKKNYCENKDVLYVLWIRNDIMNFQVIYITWII